MLVPGNTVLRLYRRADAPPILFRFPSMELGGSAIELSLYDRYSGACYGTFLSGDGSLTITSSHEVSWIYGQDLVATLPLGRVVLFDLFRLIDGKREKLDAGQVDVLGAGEFAGASSATVAGPQGVPGVTDRGDWAPGAYLARDAVTWGNSLWYALRDTSEEPGPEAVDWRLMLDGSGVAEDRETVVALAAQVSGDAQAAEAAREDAAGSSASAAASAQSADAALIAAEQARDEALARALAAEAAAEEADAARAAAELARTGAEAAIAAVAPRQLDFSLYINSGYAALIGI